MSDEGFRELVAEMRALQREFFATPPRNRPPDLIRRAKALEIAVDCALRGAPAPSPQGRLFP